MKAFNSVIYVSFIVFEIPNVYFNMHIVLDSQAVRY